MTGPSPSVDRRGSLSIIVPVLDEEEAIGPFLAEIAMILERTGLECEILFVDDGSTDRTADILLELCRESPMIRLIRLSRNFGKEAALTAGLEAAAGDAVILMDVDLQDPPELVLDFVRLWQAGYDVVYGQRVSRRSDTLAKRVTARLFYRFFNGISSQQLEPDAGDFRLLSRRAVDATLQLRERNRFMKGIFAWVGFPTVGVPYARPPRSAGNSKFDYWKLWNLALDGLTNFSTVPLRIWTYIGGLTALAAAIYAIIIIIRTLVFGVDVPGYASLLVVMLFLGAAQLISLGIIGEYLGRLHIEVKRRPIYLVREQAGRGIGPAPAGITTISALEDPPLPGTGEATAR